jgi:DNA-binding transcriptional MerR regulator
MRSEHHAVYVISVAAELAGMHPQTLRIYERRGLVQPARTQGGNRRYSDHDIALLKRIADLAGEGMNLEGIRRVMALEMEVDALRAENAELRDLPPQPSPRPTSAPRAVTWCPCARRSRCSAANVWAADTQFPYQRVPPGSS